MGKSKCSSQSSPTISEMVRNLRMAKNMTMGELARSSGVGQATISETESNTHTPRVSTLIKILQALS
jgi:transcriptional regulator with XRE-family HTH domain